MHKIDRRIRSLIACLLLAAPIPLPANLAARSATPQEAQPQKQQERTPASQGAGEAPAPGSPESRPAPRALPQVTGTVLTWNGYRIDLRTPDGKMQQVAVNEDTERLVEIAQGAEITVEYRRKIGDFFIAERVRPVSQAGAEAQPGTAPATVTGTVVSWTEAALVLRTEKGDVTIFLSPRTEHLVKPLAAGLPVTVEYQEIPNDGRLATRIRAAGTENAPEPPQKPANP